MIHKAIGDIEEKNENKCLVFDCTDEIKEVLKKYTEPWDGIKKEIETISRGKAGKHGKNFIKIKLISDDNLSLDKLLKRHILALVNKSFFEEDGKFYPEMYLDECLGEL